MGAVALTARHPVLLDVPPEARSVAEQWSALTAPTPDPAPFDPASTDALPAPVARWLRHAIDPGTPLTRTVVLSMHGHIRLGAWRPFRARQVLAAESGFIWSASARFGPLAVQGFDRSVAGQGEMRWRLLGVVPVMSADGPHVTRSAAGRLAIETMMTPTAALAPSVRWRAVDHERARARADVGGFTHHIEVRVDEDGRLVSATMPRWGNPLGEPYGTYPFGVRFTGERRSDGVAMAERLEAGWFPESPRWADGAFFRATLDDALHL